MTVMLDRPSDTGGTLLEPGVPESPAPPRRATAWWWLVLVGGLGGIVTGGWQMVERLNWAANPATPSVCDISATLSCSSVFSHWQSSALGIPNALIGIPVFAMLASAGLSGVLGSRPAKAYVASMLGLAVFMTGFITWYLEQSAFAMQALCLFCLGCGAFILLCSVGLTRVADAEQALGSGRAGRALHTLVHSNSDLILWGGLAVVVGVMIYAGLWI